MNQRQLEYVMSGLGHTRMLQITPTQTSDAYKSVVAMLKRMQGMNGHLYSCLFNAHTEKNFGPIINDFYRDGWYKVHSDSGGLQIVTQGLDIDAKMKENIYSVQCQYSDIGMSFDEIPVILTNGRSDRNDVKNRIFDDHNFEDFARKTGENLRDQLRYFADNRERLKSTCKPLMIIQGNCVETYQKWTEVVLKQIPDDLMHGIGGISLGAAGLGTGTMEDIERMFSLKALPAPDYIKNTLHILGVGSAMRMLPAITFIKNGVFDGVHVSYDSTTHSSGLSLGYIYNEKKQGLYKIEKRDLEWLTAAVNQRCGTNVEADWIWSAFSSNEEFFEKYPGKYHERWQAIMGFLIYSTTNFTGVMDKLLHDEDFFLKFVTKYKLHPYLTLPQVETLEDFKLWKSELQRHVKSNRVRKASDVQTKASLEGLFE